MSKAVRGNPEVDRQILDGAKAVEVLLENAAREIDSLRSAYALRQNQYDGDTLAKMDASVRSMASHLHRGLSVIGEISSSIPYALYTRTCLQSNNRGGKARKKSKRRVP